MKTLVIDTSTERTSCSLFSKAELIFTAHHDGATEHAEVLPKMVAAALKVDSSIDQVVVGMGPGPFTGLRVGIVFAQSFALARSIPCIGICSLDGIDIDGDDYIVITDARRNEIYWAHYKLGERVQGPYVSKVEELRERSEPKFGLGFTDPVYPSPHLLLAKARGSQISTPLYLRRPDAIPSSERK